MTLFIIVILAAALIESMLRLSLVPRFWNWLVFLLAAPLPLLFRQRIGSASLAELNRFLSSAENLESWCALVVIQELLVLLIGSALLKEYVLGEKLKRWKFAALLPSVLLPVGILYAEVLLFNHFVFVEFRTLAILLAIGVVVVGGGGGELLRLIFRDRFDRVRAVMNFEWILLLLAIFLPVAASGRLAQDAPSSVVSFDFVVIGVLVLIVGIVMAIFTVIGKYKERKFYEHHHRNP